MQIADSSIAEIDAEMREIKAAYQAAVDERISRISDWVAGKIDLQTYIASGEALAVAGDENAAARLRVMANPNFRKWQMRNAENVADAA